MHILIPMILAIQSINPFPKEERSIQDCEKGGFYLNNSINIALCWGDDRNLVNYWMHEMGYINANQYPTANDGLNFQGGNVLGYAIDFVFTNFKSGELVDINVGYHFSEDQVSYHNLNNLYKRLHKYFINNSYALEKETPRNKIFDREFSSCDGDCGMMPYKDGMLDMEIVAFLTGHAEQFTNFTDSSANVEINIGVMKWTYINNRIDSTYTLQTKYPVVGLNISSPEFFKKIRVDRNKRRRK